jgi:hypothetical protein
MTMDLFYGGNRSVLPVPWMLFVVTQTGGTIVVNVAAHDTISDVKAKIHDKYDIPTHQQKLIFDGEIYADDMILEFAGFPFHAFIHLLGHRRLEVKVFEGDGRDPREVEVMVTSGDDIQSVRIKISAITGIDPWRMELREALSRRPISAPRLYTVSRIRCEIDGN